MKNFYCACTSGGYAILEMALERIFSITAVTVIRVFKNMAFSKTTFAFLWLFGVLVLPCSGSIDNATSPITDVVCNHTGLITVMDLEKTFSGSVYALDHYFDPSCRYDVPLRTTNESLSFFFPGNNCGTIAEELDGYIYLSTNIVIQKYRTVQTTWDVVHNISCKFEIPDTKEEFNIFGHATRSDPFKIDDLVSWMEFSVGSDIFNSKVANKLSVGEEFLLAVYLKDGGENKDIRMTRCWAHEKEMVPYSKFVTQLHDIHSCQPSEWTSEFKLVDGAKNVSDKIVYARLKAFKFPSTIEFQITCTVEVCKHDCQHYCNSPESSRNNHIIPLKNRTKRSVPSIPSNRSINERVRLMKATIKALGASLIKHRQDRSRSENSANFYKRISNSTSSVQLDNDGGFTTDDNRHETTFNSYVPTTTTNYKSPSDILTENGNVTVYNSEVTWNTIYHFNLTTSVIMLSSLKLKDKYMPANFQFSSDCLPKVRFILVTSMLSFFLFCLIFVCIALSLYLRKEKKKNRIDNFLLYNFY